MAQGKISAKQQEILEYIKETILKKGYPPSVREICEAVSLKSTSSVHSHLETLEKNGYIRRDPTKPRTIEIVDDSFNLTRREVVNVPLIGSVAAGQPILAEENIENYFPIPVEFLPNESIFMLRVKGESMINAGIFDGDQVLVKQQNTARNGENRGGPAGGFRHGEAFLQRKRILSAAAGKRRDGADSHRSCGDSRHRNRTDSSYGHVTDVKTREVYIIKLCKPLSCFLQFFQFSASRSSASRNFPSLQMRSRS